MQKKTLMNATIYAPLALAVLYFLNTHPFKVVAKTSSEPDLIIGLALF